MDTINPSFSHLLHGKPDAIAVIRGNSSYPRIHGNVNFYALPESGILIVAEIMDLPDTDNMDAPVFFAFHIHETGNCSDNFSKTGNHYNPNMLPHPKHAGDLPPLLSNNGYAWMAFYNDFLTLPMLLDRSVVIHQAPDDFTTQPAGNAGEKIACGIIKKH